MKEVDISEFKSDKNEYEIIVNSGELAFTKSMEQFVGNSEDAYIEEDSIADNFFKETIIPKKLTLWDRFKQTRIFKKLYCFFNIKVTLDYPQIEENSSYYMTENSVNEQQNISFM